MCQQIIEDSLFVMLLFIFFWPVYDGYVITGHFVEAQILEAIGVDYIDESEVLTPADDAHHINKHNYRIPFVCGCRNLGEQRIFLWLYIANLLFEKWACYVAIRKIG